MKNHNTISSEDLSQLRHAKELLEHQSVAIKIANMIGTPFEYGLKRLPSPVSNQIATITQKTLMKVADTAVHTLDTQTKKKAANWQHKVMGMTSGAIGGFMGLPGLAFDLPLSTGIIMRSIMDIARENGEDIEQFENKLACMEVFALGGNSTGDDAVDSSYFAVRSALSKYITDAAKYVASGQGSKKVAAPVLVRLITQIAQRFSIPVSEKIMAQAIPILGAAGGAAINTLFIDHFQDMAKGHFTVRRLERKYGKEVIQDAYNQL